MSKRLAIAVVACACVAVAYGAVTKVTLFVGVGPDSDADGMAILNFKSVQGNMIAQVILSDLDPNTEYVVALREPGTWSLNQFGEVEFSDVSKPPMAGIGFFAISAENLEADSRGHLTMHEQTTPDSGNFTDYDVLVFTQMDWNVNPPDEEGYSVPVRVIGYNGTPAP